MVYVIAVIETVKRYGLEQHAFDHYPTAREVLSVLTTDVGMSEYELQTEWLDKAMRRLRKTHRSLPTRSVSTPSQSTSWSCTLELCLPS